MKIPDVGNIHHFCNRLLSDNDLIPPGVRVVDEIAQRELIEDVWVQLKKELRERKKKHELCPNPQVEQMTLLLEQEEKEVRDAVCVLDAFTPNPPKGMQDHDYYAGLLSEMSEYEELCAKVHRSIYPDLVVASSRIHRQTVGVPFTLLRPLPNNLRSLRANGLLSAISSSYEKLKQNFKVMDFDDLITETFLALKSERVLRKENRFEWIQVDEVQDLNALQWEIVKMVSRNDATSVFFGDVEQTIFSFIGASAERLNKVASTCTVHYFKKNFRATPYLLDILVRFSLRVLRSKRLFLPSPCETAPQRGELYCGPGGLDKAVKIALEWVREKKADNVALLVRRNWDADTLEQIIKKQDQAVRYVKVSGVEIFALPAMRDFMAFCTLLSDGGTLLDWARMFRRFAGIKYDHIARRLVKDLTDSGLTPQQFLESVESSVNFSS